MLETKFSEPNSIVLLFLLHIFKLFVYRDEIISKKCRRLKRNTMHFLSKYCLTYTAVQMSNNEVLEQFNTNIIAENVGQKYSFWSTYSLAYLTFRVEKENPFIYPLRNLYHAINIFNSAARLLLSLNCFNQMNSFMSIYILSFSQMFIVRVSFNASLLRIPQQQKLT